MRRTMQVGPTVVAAMMTMTLVMMTACGSYSTTTPPQVPQATVFSATGNVTAKVEEFRTALGAANGGTAGEQPTGRREINWDGAGANPFDNRNDFPANFFNTTVKAGAVYTTPGTGFRNDSTLFTDINAAYAAQFGAFSPTKIFAPIGSNVLEQLFQVAGAPTAALTRGFGIVLSDVDVAEKTTIQLFGKDGTSLGIYGAPVRTDAAGLSFVGVLYADAIVAKVRITLGTGALGVNVNDVTAGGAVDLVVLDNVVYGEPHAVQ